MTTSLCKLFRSKDTQTGSSTNPQLINLPMPSLHGISLIILTKIGLVEILYNRPRMNFFSILSLVNRQVRAPLMTSLIMI
jgi:hypothetical protein